MNQFILAALLLTRSPNWEQTSNRTYPDWPVSASNVDAVNCRTVRFNRTRPHRLRPFWHIAGGSGARA
jgi:hypothetical protein